MAKDPFAHVVLDPGTAGEATHPLFDRLFVGRECAGVGAAHRIVLSDDLAISRNHLELRVDPERAIAVVVDVSSNGTRVNGIRIERSVAVPLNHGDVIRLGEHALELRVLSATTRPVKQVESRSTVSISNPITMALWLVISSTFQRFPSKLIIRFLPGTSTFSTPSCESSSTHIGEPWSTMSGMHSLPVGSSMSMPTHQPRR